MYSVLGRLLCLLLLAVGCASLSENLVLSQSLESLTGGQQGRVESTDYNGDGSMLLTAVNRLITLWTRNGAGTYIKGQQITAPDSLTAVTFDNSGLKIAGGAAGSITHIWRMNPQTQQYEYWQRVNYQSDSPTQRVRAVSFSQDDSKLVTGSSDKSINVWSLDKGTDTYLFKQKLLAHTDEVVAISAQKERMISTGGFDNTIKVWLLNKAQDQYRQLQTIPVGNRVQAALLSSDESIISGGLRNGSIALWSYSDLGKSYSRFQIIPSAHSNGIYALALSEELNRIVSAGADNTTALWGRQPDGKYALIQRLQEPGNSLSISTLSQLAIGLMSNPGAATKLYMITTNCSSVANSNGTSTGANSCGCNNGYMWNNGQCTLNCNQMKNAVGTASTQLSCICSNGYYWSGSGCNRNCSLVLNSDGQNQVGGGGVCRCLNGYTWNGAECSLGTADNQVVSPAGIGIGSPSSLLTKINCKSIANSLGVNNGTNVCLCVPGYQWNGMTCSQGGTTTSNAESSTSLSLDCNNVANSAGFSNSPNTCACRDGYYWSSRSCSRSCRSVRNSNGINDGDNSCICLSGYIWDATSGQCARTTTDSGINCSGIQYSTGAASSSGNGCLCIAGFYWLTTQCVRNCKQIPNSNGIGIGTDVCFCNTGYSWNGSGCSNGSEPVPPTNTLNCMTILNAIGNNGPSACNCRSTYSWSGTACIRNCQAVANSNGLLGVGDSCQCQSGYKWSGQQCVSTALMIDCLNLPNSLGFKEQNPVICLCSNGFTFSNGNCVPVGLTGIPAGNPGGLSGQSGRDTGIFSTTNPSGTGTLVQDGLTPSPVPLSTFNCSTVKFSTGPNPTNIFVCNCQSGFIWMNGLCVVNCNTVALSTGVRIDSTTCACQDKYYWQNMQCNLNCSNQKYATNNSNASACNCQQNYEWMENQCKYACSKVKNAVGANSDTGGCNCKPNYYYYNNECRLNCSIINNTVGEKSDEQCICKQGFKWAASEATCKRNTNLGLALGLGLGLGLGLVALGLAIWGIIACCKTPPLQVQGPAPLPGTAVNPTPPFPPFGVANKPESILPSVSTLPPANGFSNRYLDQTVANAAFGMVAQPTTPTTTTTAIFPTGPSKIVEQQVIPPPMESQPRYATFNPYANPSRIEERQISTPSFIQEKPQPSQLVASRYKDRTMPYGQATTSVIGGVNSSYQYQGVPNYTPRDMTSQLSHHHEAVRPSYGFLNTESAAQSKIRSNQVSDDFIKNF